MIAPTRNRGGWSARAIDQLAAVQGVLDDLRDYWPLTLRQIYYQLVAHEVIPNRRAEYQKLSRLLTKARLDGLVGWDAIEDRAREHLKSAGWPDLTAFVGHERGGFLRGYRRDLLCSQPWALELWVEKDALSRICHEVAFNYCVPVVVARGFSSVSFLHECRKRVEAAMADGKDGLRILYFGDLDPSGWTMLPAMLATLQDEMGLGDAVEGVRCALTPEQVAEHALPHSVEAMKEGDSRTPRYRGWLREHGHPEDLAVELDALPPQVLEGLVRASIEDSLDLDRFDEEQRIEAIERRNLAALRQRVLRALDDAQEDLS